jgi:hypothetical protein
MTTQKNIIILTTHSNRGENGEWESGDQVITEGLFNLLPELNDHKTTLIASVPVEDQDAAIKECDYVIHAGTPSWMNLDFRRNWRSCEAYKKRISFLGIGLAVPYEGDFWYGREDFTMFKNTGLIDFIVCRDKYAMYWIRDKVGTGGAKLVTYPCPALYMLEEAPPRRKERVVFSIANIEETSHASVNTFRDYYRMCRYTVDELRLNGASVSITYQRAFGNHPGFIHEMKSLFQGYPLVGFNTPAEFRAFHQDQEVYIGVRNHGALPMAGAGKPSLLLGTDNRQMLAEEIPFIGKFDISFCGMNPREVLDWYNALPSHGSSGISSSLINFRRSTHKRWREFLEPLITFLKK